MLLLYPCASLDQILTENVTQSIRKHEASLSNKTKICDISIFAMSQRATFVLTYPKL